MANPKGNSNGSRKGRNTGAVQRALSGFGVSDKEIGNQNWDEVSPNAIADFIVLVCKLGGGALFGRSRDGGALSITVYLEDDRRTVWIGGNEDPDQVISDAIEHFSKFLKYTS